MKLKEVESPYDEKSFLKVAHIIYRKDKTWVCPLDQDIQAVFDPRQNLYYQTGACKRWLLYDDSDELIGRVASFYHDRYMSQSGSKTGGMGFFECIDDKDAASLLLNTCKEWLQSNGITGMDGPINFGEKDRFWGLMVKGFSNPSYLENYNPPYYQKFFEDFGFKQSIEQSTSEINVRDFGFERFSRVASRVTGNPVYRFEHYRNSELTRFANDFVYIYNLAWSARPDFTPMTKERVKTILKGLQSILLEDLIWFVYANDEPAGFYVNVIDVNQIFKHLKGKMNMLAKIKFLWYKNFGRIDRCRGIVFGVIPAFQNHGLEAGMIIKFYEAIMRYANLRTSELAWIGDFNPKMHSLFRALGAEITKVHYTYNIKF